MKYFIYFLLSVLFLVGMKIKNNQLTAVEQKCSDCVQLNTTLSMQNDFLEKEIKARDGIIEHYERMGHSSNKRYADLLDSYEKALSELVRVKRDLTQWMATQSAIQIPKEIFPEYKWIPVGNSKTKKETDRP